MKKLKIVTVVGTRPEIIRLSRVISKLNNYVEHPHVEPASRKNAQKKIEELENLIN